MDLVFATNNKNKIKEITLIIGAQHRIRSLEEIGCREELPETSPTLEGNALQKARFVHQRYGGDCFADDTGLEINALDGRPGVYSARYAGPECKAADNMAKVLEEMKGTADRSARFRTVIALILEGREYLFEGEVKGSILEQEKGNEGFGYDPVFQPTGYSTSFAGMSIEEKNRISHRSAAVKKLADFLREKLG